MPRRPRQKAPRFIPDTRVWNTMWQAFCPWVAGKDVSPRVKRPRATGRLYSTTFAAVILGAVATTEPDAGMSMATSYATEPSPQVLFASFDASATMPHGATPQIFGYAEKRHSDIRPFTKWTGVLERFKADLQKNAEEQHVRDWINFIARAKHMSRDEQLRAVNDYMNKFPFQSDKNNYGQIDYWATPMEFLSRGKGDCEDYAFAKYVTLRALGFSDDHMRMTIVNDSVMRTPHALLVVYQDGVSKVLDSQNPDILDSADITRYKPIYSISQVAWWRH
jgi:predicted transglutaminase-like cysteine proteinase